MVNQAGPQHVRVPLKHAVMALVSAPVILALSMAPLVAYLTARHHLRDDALMEAIQPLSPIPLSIGFGLIFILTSRLARRDGLTLMGIGWTRPTKTHLVAAAIAATIMVAVSTQLAYPAIQDVRPGFDPAVPAIPFAPAVLMLLMATVAEDTLYRGYALHQLSARLGRPVAALLTSTAYALLAPGQGWPLTVFALVLGCALCALRFATGSLAPVVIAHLATALAPKMAAAIDLSS